MLHARHWSTAGLVTLGTGAAALLFVLVAAVRLFLGPISLGPFAGALAGALAEALPGIDMRYDQAAIEWSRDEGKVNLVILGTRISDAEGHIIAQAPKADIDLAAAPLLQGRAVVRRIALVGVQLTLVRTRAGGLRLGFGGAGGDDDLLRRISDVLTSSKGPSSLQSFAVRHARLAFFDETTGLFAVSPEADLRLTDAADGNLAVGVDASVEISGRPAHVAGRFVFPPQGHRVTGSLDVAGLKLSALAENTKTFAALKGAALGTDAHLRFVFVGPKIESLDFTATATGALFLPKVEGPVKVNSLKLVGHYDGSGGKLSFADAGIDADRIKGRFKGDILFSPDGIGVDLRLGKLALTLPGVFAQPVAFQAVALEGRWDKTARTFEMKNLAATGSPFGLHATGTVSLPSGRSAGFALTGTIGAMQVRDFVRYWPLVAAKGGRAWVDENMPAGKVGPMAFKLAIAPGALDAPRLPTEAVELTFPLSGVEANYIHGLTHLTAVAGTARLTGTDFAIDVASGKVGALTLTKGRFYIPDLNAEGSEIDARLSGTMAEVLKLIDMKPLGYPSRYGVETKNAAGSAALDLKFSVPLRHDLHVADVGISVKATTEGLGLALGPHMRLTDGKIVFVVDNDHLRASGTTGLGGSASRLAVDWNEDFRSGPKVTTRIAVKGALDDKARASLDLGTDGYLKGQMGVTGTLTGRRGGLAEGAFTLDLTPAAVTVDLAGISKPSGFPMNGRLALRFGAHSHPSEMNLRISGRGAAATVAAGFAADGTLSALSVPSLRFGGKDDFSLTLMRGAAGTEISVNGRSLDGSRIFRQSAGAAAGGESGKSGKSMFDGPWRVVVALDRLMLHEGVSAADFRLDLSGIGDRPADFRLSGSLGKKGAMTGGIVRTEAGRDLHLTVEDAGRFFKGLYGFSGMHGGKLEAKAFLPGQAADPPGHDANAPDYKGEAKLKDFRVVDQPFLARLFTAGSLVGLTNLFAGEGIAVDAFTVPFSARRNVIAVNGARATGPAIGITADGYLDRPNRSLALKGTLVPLYGLNSVLGNIPILGNVLTSKAGEGIIGMSYSVKGDIDEPQVSVNPLSVLAPGIFRRIFEGKIPNAVEAPSNNPPVKAPDKPAKK